ncbi:hypothetical protein [Haloarcula sp. JP-L23]|uniref:hypothetical protein n=1 Tax=Haloarcula sp. JP-L23 TaxID=2716717 RepID=UPI00140EE6F6|nr:hypothetical protein G9465_18245 [Haloarcula sp. JP-L23]
MQLNRLRTRAKAALRDESLGFGWFLLLLLTFSAAFLGSLVLAMLAYGVLFVTGGSEPLLTAFATGSRSAAQILDSFTAAESSFYLMSLCSALFMGAFAYWAYQKMLAGLDRLRRWARTAAFRQQP